MIQNYDPRNGHYYMKVTNLSTNETIKDTQIIPKQVDEGLWSVQISHYLAPQIDEETALGDYELEVYAKDGSAIGKNFFKITKSSLKPVGFEQMGILMEPSESTDNANILPVDANEHQIPNWIHTIFVWYAEKSISDKELLQALQHLIDEKILIVNNS